MSKRRGGRGSKYPDEFKQRLVAESHGDGVSVLTVSRRHGVPTNRIYAWRGDARFQPVASDDAGFISVEISGGDHNAVLRSSNVTRLRHFASASTLTPGYRLSAAVVACDDCITAMIACLVAA